MVTKNKHNTFNMTLIINTTVSYNISTTVSYNILDIKKLHTKNMKRFKKKTKQGKEFERFFISNL